MATYLPLYLNDKHSIIIWNRCWHDACPSSYDAGPASRQLQHAGHSAGPIIVPSEYSTHLRWLIPRWYDAADNLLMQGRCQAKLGMG